MNLAQQFASIRKNASSWAITCSRGSAHSQLLKQLQHAHSPLVSFRHSFKTLSNTSNFYYQQRFNSFDSDDAATVYKWLQEESNGRSGYWTIEKLADRLSLASIMQEEVIKLSNGETRRVLIAAALLKNPTTILLDHPLTGLDQASRSSFNSLLNDILASGIEIIMAVEPRDIPENIGHIAFIEGNRLTAYPSRDIFLQQHNSEASALPIDEGLLKHLLSFRKPGNYQHIVQMQNVSIRNGDRLLIDQVNWTVKPGEHWVLSGPNGAGKSTLLSLITGDNPQAYANQIWLFDRRRGSGESIWDIKQKIGYVSPELFQYFPTDQSCKHVVESGFYDSIGLFRRSDPLRAGIVQQWMHLLHLGDFADRVFSQVPPDVQRLCLLARALVKNPPLLVLDEPTQGLDQPEQEFFTRLIGSIAEQSNSTIIFVSHYEEHIPANFRLRLRLENGKQLPASYP